VSATPPPLDLGQEAAARETPPEDLFQRIKRLARENPRAVQGVLGAIMGIPSEGGFLEGLQGGISGTTRALGAFDAARAKEAEDAQKRSMDVERLNLDRRRAVLDEMRYFSPNARTDPVQMEQEKRAAYLKWLQGLSPDQLALYRGWRPRLGAGIRSEAIAARVAKAISDAFPAINPEDALILSRFGPTTVSGNTLTVLRKPSEGEPKGWAYVNETIRNPVSVPNPISRAILKKYGVDPMKFYNEINYDWWKQLDENGLQGEGDIPDQGEGADTQSFDSMIDEETDLETLANWAAAPDASEEEYNRILDRMRALGDPDPVGHVDRLMGNAERSPNRMNIKPQPSHTVGPYFIGGGR